MGCRPLQSSQSASVSSVTFTGPPAARYGGQWTFSPTPRPGLYHSITSCSKLGPEVGSRGKSPVPSKLASESPSSHGAGPRPSGAPPSQGPLSWRPRFISDGGAQPRGGSLPAELPFTLVRCQPPVPDSPPGVKTPPEAEMCTAVRSALGPRLEKHGQQRLPCAGLRPRSWTAMTAQCTGNRDSQPLWPKR